MYSKGTVVRNLICACTVHVLYVCVNAGIDCSTSNKGGLQGCIIVRKGDQLWLVQSLWLLPVEL